MQNKNLCEEASKYGKGILYAIYLLSLHFFFPVFNFFKV